MARYGHGSGGIGTKQPLVSKVGSQYDGEAAVRHYFMAMGVDSQSFGAQRGTIKSGRKVVINEGRKIGITSALLHRLSDRQQNWKKCGLGYSKSKTVEVVLHALTASASQTEGNTSTRSGSQLRKTYTPLQLLATYKKSFISDEPQLNFDFASFMVACARLFRTISESTTGDDHMDLVASLLRSSPSSPLITTVSTIVKSHIAENGKLFTKKAYDQSSSRIPKSPRPKIQTNLETKETTRHFISTIFEYSDTKYCFSSRAMAAYHPKVKPEHCTAECRG